jgi:hypothetical protein
MVRKLLILVLAILPGYSFAQIDFHDNDAYCAQYQQIYRYIMGDSTFLSVYHKNEKKIFISDSIRYGVGHPFMTNFYLAHNNGFSEDALNLKDSTYLKQWRQIEKDEYKNTNPIYSPCLHQLSDANKCDIYIDFTRKDETTVAVWIKPCRKLNSFKEFGLLYLFIFSDKEIVNICVKRLTE